MFIEKINIFEYRDFRKYLQDWYSLAKKQRRSFSYRVFSRKAGLSSPNFLKLVMDGERNLSEQGVEKFALGLELNKSESDFFHSLVLFNQAKDFDDKVFYEKKMMRSKKLAELSPVEHDQFFLYNAWYHPVVLELLNSKDFDGTPNWLVRKISPKVTLTQVEKSIQLLERLGFVKKVSEKKWEPSTPVVTTGPEASSFILMDFHKNLMKLCYDMLPKIPAEQRDVSSLTIGLPKRKIPELKKCIQEFRNDIVKQFSVSTPPEEVVLLNIQMLPVTGVKEIKSL